MKLPVVFYLSSFLVILGFQSPLQASSLTPKPANPEFELAITLTPDLDKGKQLYRNCITCHGPEGWGTESGSYPQIAGQLDKVIIKQLADYRAGNRDNPIMRAFSSRRALGDAQDIADVAAYISQLPMTRYNGKGPVTTSLQKGKSIYGEQCLDCHGALAEGISADYSPLLQGQHFNYLIRQFDWIRIGKRRNADEKMTKQIKDFTLKDEISVLSYVSSIAVDPDKLAEPGWQNPDFPKFVRK